MVEMSRNLLRAAACNFATLSFMMIILMQSSLLLNCSIVNANKVKYTVCPKTLWRIDFNNSFKQGEAVLRFDIPYQEKV